MPPIHGYICSKCKNEFEIFYTSQGKVQVEEPQEKCPKCESTDKERTPPKNVSFELKGKGWYRDGY